MAVDSTETTGRFLQFCLLFPHEFCRELGWAPSHNGLTSVPASCCPREGLCDMLKDFQESLCQSREPLSTLRAFLLLFPLHHIGSSAKEPLQHHVCRCCHSHKPSPGSWCDQGCLGSHKGPALYNTRQISSPIPQVMTLHGNMASRTPETLSELHRDTLFAFTISSESQLKANPMP